jgi:hypothetical protein
VKDGQSVPASHGRVKHTDTQLDGEKKKKTIFLFSSIEKNKNKIKYGGWVGVLDVTNLRSESNM